MNWQIVSVGKFQEGCRVVVDIWWWDEEEEEEEEQHYVEVLTSSVCVMKFVGNRAHAYLKILYFEMMYEKGVAPQEHITTVWVAGSLDSGQDLDQFLSFVFVSICR